MNVFKCYFLNSIDYYKYISYVLGLMSVNYLIDQEIKLIKTLSLKISLILIFSQYCLYFKK